MDNTPTKNLSPWRSMASDPELDSTPVDTLRPISFTYAFNALSSLTATHHKSKHWIPSRVLKQSLGSNLSPEVNDLFHAILDAMILDEAEVLKMSDNRCVACGQIPRAGVGRTIWFTHSPSARPYGFIHTWVYLVCGHECDMAMVWGMIRSGPPGHGVEYYWPDLETVVMWRAFNVGADDSAAKIPSIVVTKGD